MNPVLQQTWWDGFFSGFGVMTCLVLAVLLFTLAVEKRAERLLEDEEWRSRR